MLPVVQGKRLERMDDEVVARLKEGATRVVVDVGAGDARTAYRAARARPEWLVVALDPAWQRMSETSTRAMRKPAKGGTPNLLPVCGTVEEAPAALHGIADELWVLMPWGSLLHGIVRGDAAVWGGLRRLAAPGAALVVTVGLSIWREPVPREIRGLPELTPAYASEVLGPRMAALGWRLEEATVVEDGADPEGLRSSWSRRLGSDAPEPVLTLRATAVPLGAG